MRNFIEKALKGTKTAAAVCAFAFCIFATDTVSEAVSGAVERCVNVVIPSLFAMMIISGLLVRSGMISAVPRFIGVIGEKLLGMERFVLPVFTFGMFAGYPVGAKMICAQYENGHLDKKRAELLCGLCFGAGPAFIFGCISGRLYSSPSAGIAILVSNITANIIIAAAFSPILRKTISRNSGRKSISLSADMLTQSVLGAGRSMADICMMIAAFSVISAILSQLGISEAAGRLISEVSGRDNAACEAIFRCALDVTAAEELPCGDYSLLPVISSLTSFGGLCVIFQISAITSGKLSVRPLIFIRLTAAVMSFFICRIVMPFILRNEAVTAAAVNISIHKGSSPVPSVMLILMTAVLFLESAEERSQGKA